MTGPVVFVGREGELSRLLATLAGVTRLVLVVGDAGVGKTRFAREGMARAAAAGAVTVRGECLPLTDALPLLPVAAALGELAKVDGGGLLEAALEAAPGYARGEVGRLLPQLGSVAVPDSGNWDEGWRRGRLFSAVAELLGAAADVAGSRIGLVIEDVHWADGATLDFLTFLTHAGHQDAVTVVATCRSDEAPLAVPVANWLAQVRAAAGMEEIRLGPLSRMEAAALVAVLADGPVPAEAVDELFARAEGNPFFTEQLVAAGLTGQNDGGPGTPGGLPARLAELLAARAGRCAGEAREVLAGLAVAGRALTEDLLAAVTGLDADTTRRGLRELAAARLLAEDTTSQMHRPRHMLLAEAVAAGLLPGERAALHEATARALAADGDEKLAAEVAGHWRAAGRPAEELPARVAAAEAAERVFGYAEAAAHWQRAIELSQALPDADGVAGTAVPQMYVRAIDALRWSGAGARAGGLAEDAYRRLTGDVDPGTAAAICHRAAVHRAIDAASSGLSLIEEALRLYEQGPPSARHAEAWHDYAWTFLRSAEGRFEDVSPALGRALEIAEAAGATALIPRVLASLAGDAFLRGQVEEGFAALQRAWALTRASNDGVALVWLAMMQSNVLLTLARFGDAADAALTGLRSARLAGLQASWWATVLAANASDALLAGGGTAEAAALLGPLTAGPPDRDHWPLYACRAEIDLLCGDIDGAAGRWQMIDAVPARMGSIDYARETAQRAAELAVWAGRPGDALDEVQRVLPVLKAPDPAIFCGRLLTAGMRACADLAEQARARRDEPGIEAATAAASGLVSWVDQVAAAPFTEHPYVVTIPAERATWNAERTRLAGASDPDAWSVAAKMWQDLGWPHRAGYAAWRQAQAQLDSGQSATAAAAALRAAAAAAAGHAPLLVQVRRLADRARIPLQPAAADASDTSRPAKALAPYGLTARELAVLRLLVAGRTNAQIGAELYISPSTASVHVTSILRKLGVSSRVQAAAVAERADLLSASDPKAGSAEI